MAGTRVKQQPKFKPGDIVAYENTDGIRVWDDGWLSDMRWLSLQYDFCDVDASHPITVLSVVRPRDYDRPVYRIATIGCVGWSELERYGDTGQPYTTLIARVKTEQEHERSDNTCR